MTDEAPRRLRARVDNLAAGTGDAVCRDTPLGVVFADRGWPGDEVEGEIVEVRPRFARLRVDAVHPARPDTADACPHRARCGGCRFQGASADLEWRWKEEAALEAVRRLARDVTWPDPEVFRSPSTAGWRHRVTWEVSADGRPGYHHRRGHEVFAVEGCPVLHPALQALLLRLHARGGLAPGARVQAEWSGDALAMRWSLWPPDAASLHADLRAWGVVALTGPGGTPTGFAATVGWLMGTRPVPCPPGLFHQAHRALNGALVRHVVAGLAGGGALPGPVLELYAGSGNFTFPLLEAGQAVVAVEGRGPALEAARAATAAEDRVSWHAVDLDRPLPQGLRRAWARAGALLTDAPRAGIHAPVAGLLGEPGPRRWALVSCDIPTLARDVGRAVKVGWALERWSLWEMFPRTHHLEAVAWLSRPGGRPGPPGRGG
jgi:tRNA/tmRNA/rRNA uracil-C5-methylase (TrmA/RlmC/RlmD family)